jgi:hypothetical protein
LSIAQGVGQAPDCKLTSDKIDRHLRYPIELSIGPRAYFMAALPTRNSRRFIPGEPPTFGVGVQLADAAYHAVLFSYPASIQNNVIVIYDNDAEGVANYGWSCALNVPANMLILKLPDSPDFAEFSTIGPNGRHKADINGCAAAIECYLDLGALPLVRWTSFNSRTDTRAASTRWLRRWRASRRSATPSRAGSAASCAIAEFFEQLLRRPIGPPYRHHPLPLRIASATTQLKRIAFPAPQPRCLLDGLPRSALALTLTLR